MTFLAPLWLALLPLVLGLVYLLYRRRKPKDRKIAGLWLWQKALKQGQARRRFDLRLLLLLLAAASMMLALSRPQLALDRPGPLILILDASASMDAADLSPSRLEYAKKQAAERLRQSPQAVLVRAGDRPQAFGPAAGSSLLGQLGGLKAGDRRGDLEAALRLGQARLPGARVWIISDSTPPKLAGHGYLNVAGSGQNVGISAVGPGFVAVANAGPGPWSGEVLVEGKGYDLEVAAGGFKALEVPHDTFEAQLPGQDALAADNQAQFNRRLVGVEVVNANPALERLLSLLGASLTAQPEIRFEVGTPKEVPRRFSVFFAAKSSAQATVFDVERTQPYLRGVELVGFELGLAAKPGAGWQPLITDATARALAWYSPTGLYLPPIQSLQNLPAFPVLLYNLIAPRSELRKGLLTPSETLLPRPAPSQPLPPSTLLDFTPWLALLAGLLLGVEWGWFGWNKGTTNREPGSERSGSGLRAPGT
jgi:hypothetical protein